jgi:hypothetical protein
MQSIQSLLECCDFVIVFAGGDDGTFENVSSIKSDKLKVVLLTELEWQSKAGSGKLAEFQNWAIQLADNMGYEYVLLIQSDEIIHERSYKAIREAVNENHNGYMCHRTNLWGTPFMKLKVPANRQPCSTEVVRLTKSSYRSYGDGESINTIPNMDYIDKIEIVHLGFVRKREVMVDKIKNMQISVFQMSEADQKLNGMTIFDPYKWFDKYEDLELINEPLPEVIKNWAEARAYSN